MLIVGLGQIGSSIAKASKNKGIIVHGFAINESSLSTALEDNIIDSSFDSMESINHKDLEDKIDLIVISVSPKNTQNILNQIKNLWNTNITITETASVKNHLSIFSASNIILSHPIAGSHKSGISSIDENLFQNKKTIVCNPNNVNDIYNNKFLIIDFSNKMKKTDSQIKDFLTHNMYNNKKVIINTNKGKRIIRDLFMHLIKNPKKYINENLFVNDEKERVIADFIAGMTDRYAINLHKKIK